MRRVFWDELLRRSGAGGGGAFFVWKILYFCSKNPAAESSLSVSLAFLEFSFSLLLQDKLLESV